MKWISAIKTGHDSDTNIFIVGAFDTEDEANQAAKDKLGEIELAVKNIKKLYESHSDSWEDLSEAENKLFRILGVDYISANSKWETVIAKIPDTIGGRVFKIY